MFGRRSSSFSFFRSWNVSRFVEVVHHRLTLDSSLLKLRCLLGRKKSFHSSSRVFLLEETVKKKERRVWTSMNLAPAILVLNLTFSVWKTLPEEATTIVRHKLNHLQWGLEIPNVFRFWMVESCSVIEWFKFQMFLTKWPPFCLDFKWFVLFSSHHSKTEQNHLKMEQNGSHLVF